VTVRVDVVELVIDAGAEAVWLDGRWQRFTQISVLATVWPARADSVIVELAGGDPGVVCADRLRMATASELAGSWAVIAEEAG
jgi:hypothetical protein